MGAINESVLSRDHAVIPEHQHSWPINAYRFKQRDHGGRDAYGERFHDQAPTPLGLYSLP